jgi:hypothetical protein
MGEAVKVQWRGGADFAEEREDGLADIGRCTLDIHPGGQFVDAVLPFERSKRGRTSRNM